MTAPEDSSHPVGKVARDDHGARLPRSFRSPCWRAPVSGSTGWGEVALRQAEQEQAAAQLAEAQARCFSGEEAARGVSLPVFGVVQRGRAGPRRRHKRGLLGNHEPASEPFPGEEPPSAGDATGSPASLAKSSRTLAMSFWRRGSRAGEVMANRPIR